MAQPNPLPQPREHSVAAEDDDPDERVILYGISWDQYLTISDALPDHAGLRMTYLDGALEIMTTGRSHELRKTVLARLVEAYADFMEIDMNGFGNATYRKKAKKRGLEPDESYVFSDMEDDDPEVPELAIEIAWSRGGLPKLEVYRGLEVPEVWLYHREGHVSVHRLVGGRYEERKRSGFLPGLDLELLVRFVDVKNQRKAVKAFREAIAKKP